MTGTPQVRPLQGDDPERLGSYRLIGRVGAGGMGRVYLGRTVSGRLVAVKTLLAEGEVAESDRRRFAREVALARRVTGVFTVSVLDADADGPRPWMATEYVPAPSLAELVRDGGALSPAAVRWIAAGMAEALVDLHRAEIVHRDVKPGNVLLPLTGPRLIDFGISHALDLTRTSLTLGTIAFTSPEQARGEGSTPASDVYSTGATLFHLATGRPPYEPGADAFRLLARVQQAEVSLTGLPPDVDDLIKPLLHLDPAARPTPADLLTAFERRPTGGSELLPTAWTSLIRSHHDYVPPVSPGDLGSDGPGPADLKADGSRPADLGPDDRRPDDRSPDGSRPADRRPDGISDVPRPDGRPDVPRPDGRPDGLRSDHAQVADGISAVHHATTRTARPQRVPVPAPSAAPAVAPAVAPSAAPAVVPSPPPLPTSSPRARPRAGAALRTRRVWIPTAAALTAAVLVGGYVAYDRLGGENPVEVGACLSNTRTAPAAYSPGEAREVDCSASTARFTVTAVPGADGACPSDGRPTERFRTRNLCVSPYVREGDCLDTAKGFAGLLPADLLWTAHPCADGSQVLQLRVVEVAESLYNLVECGPAYTFEPESLPWTETSHTDYCLKQA
ncbi:serine/threonine-protein kinase [Streptomyces wedmorensis]|uniref:Serine/threonine-protein kinase n=1 Tax=Streptomyces wedmorensis TaxID=43759 RepID=A0ABW6IUU0_STRWE